LDGIANRWCGPRSYRVLHVCDSAPAIGKIICRHAQAKELVRSGLYSRIRNPIYVFVDVMIFGLILALHLYWLFALYPLLVAMHVFRAHREAHVLRGKFGQAYLDYRDQTWF
jgi:protein-S-isoprenylcysteine O-methyltransferase Ste14